MHAYEAIVRPGDTACLPDLAKCDFSFEVTVERSEPFEGGQTIPVAPPYRKTYDFSTKELAGYIEDPNRGLFVAQVNGSSIGYIALSQGWNNYAIIEDFAVDVSYRGMGIARRLMDIAVQWAREAAMAGIRLETQSNNVAACRFYGRYGFVLGGYDRYLYQAMRPGTREVALFWYLPFARQSSSPVP
ncbi:GNAT family N-acetyltransferase [Microvirga guangxiensis]|uniref:Streptothricin acetyltransferase n=1 Tax=Microvirga guangxiensis TaxID=549386 RepID=A0A1G5KKB1_9HYPH|nr:GNAT family N-acetyltransferase [Microvirga guangxiensis]SCZ00661.1 streptothricin acetyltransferase [Microvirga guangxiensis]